MLLVPCNLSLFANARSMPVVFTPSRRASRLLFGRKGTARRIDGQHRVVGALNDRVKDCRVDPGASASSSYPHLLEVLLNPHPKLARLVHSRHPFRVSSASISSTVVHSKETLSTSFTSVYFVSPLSATRKPMGRRFGSGGVINCRIASKTTLN